MTRADTGLGPGPRRILSVITWQRVEYPLLPGEGGVRRAAGRLLRAAPERAVGGDRHRRTLRDPSRPSAQARRIQSSPSSRAASGAAESRAPHYAVQLS